MPRLWRWAAAAAVLACAAGFCPKGFGGGGQMHPVEWRIPPWPQDMNLQEQGGLYTVTLGGFGMKEINEEYLEGPGSAFRMQGSPTYWQASGKYFLYHCKRLSKWRIAEISAFGDNMDGQCFAFASDGMSGRDILNPSLIKGWIEVENGEWAIRREAGVVQVGTLREQMEGLSSNDEEEVTEDGGTEGAAKCPMKGSGSSGAEEGEDSNCPVMPVVRKAKKKVIEATKEAGKWVRRLFPNLLPEPSEEDAIPDGEEDADNPLFPAEAGDDGPPSPCQPDTEDMCNFKEKFYIEKMRNATAEKRRGELGRLSGMRNVAMKPAQLSWLKVRVHILRSMIRKDKQDQAPPDPSPCRTCSDWPSVSARRVQE